MVLRRCGCRRKDPVQLGGLDREISPFGPVALIRPALIARKIVLRDTPVAVAASLKLYAMSRLRSMITEMPQRAAMMFNCRLRGSDGARRAY